jgi:F1F0 ATPase subunit 2
MNAEITLLAASFALGTIAGTLYFGGLWLTVRHIAAARRPQLQLAISFILRTSVLLAIFYSLTDQGAAALIAAMAGLLLSRQLWLLGKGRIRPARG